MEQTCHFPEFQEILSGSEVLTDCLGQANNSSHPHIHAVKVTNYKCQISKSFFLPTIIDGSVKTYNLPMYNRPVVRSKNPGGLIVLWWA